MARIEEAIAREVAKGLIGRIYDAYLNGDGEVALQDRVVDAAQAVSLTTGGTLVLRFDVTQPRAEPMPDSATVAFPNDPEQYPQQADEI